MLLPNVLSLTTYGSSELNRLEFINCIYGSNLDQINIDLDRLKQSDSVSGNSINSTTSKNSQTLVGAAENCNKL